MRFVTACAAFALAAAFVSACSQDTSALTPGAADADVRRSLGSPTSVEAVAQRPPHEVERMFPKCKPTSVAAVVVVWTYEQHMRRSLLLGFGSEKTLRCVGEGGLTFVH